MKDDQYREWIKGAASLTTPQIKDLTNRIKVLSNVRSDFSGKQDFGDRVLNAVADVLRKKHVDAPSVNLMRKSAAYAVSKEKAVALSNFIALCSHSKLVQDRILRLGLSLLYDDMLQWQNVTVSPHTLLQQIHRIPATLNRHFPGYAAAGLLIKVVKGI